jgi:hypothetical protein
VQAYLGRKVALDPTQVLPKDHKLKHEPNAISMPYAKHLADPTQPETFKLISQLEIVNMGWGYTCFASSYMLFVSEKEIKTQKSQVVQFFNDKNNAATFEELGLPILNVTSSPDGTGNKAYEIDLSKKT